MSPEPASYDPEEFVDGSQPWPRLLALKDGELLAKGEVFEHQTAARPKPAKQGSEPEPKQVKHGNKVIADRLYRLPAKLLISQPDRIVTRHNGSNRNTEYGHFYGRDSTARSTAPRSTTSMARYVDYRVRTKPCMCGNYLAGTARSSIRAPFLAT